LRGLRAGSLGVAGFVLALTAHVVAGGAAPAPVVLTLAAGLIALAALLVTAVRLSLLQIGVSLAAMQVVLHEGFMWLAAPSDCTMTALTAVTTGSATKAAQIGQDGQPAMVCAAGMTPAGMGQASAFGAAAMLVAHVAATAVMVVLLAHGERVLWFLVRLVFPASCLRVHLPQLPAVKSSSSTAAPVVRARVRLASGGVGRRGPPVLSAIV
jgi:hypothetical protein